MISDGALVRRGRPLNLERRETILRAALALFARRGFYGTTMHAVAEASEKGTEAGLG